MAASARARVVLHRMHKIRAARWAGAGWCEQVVGKAGLRQIILPAEGEVELGRIGAVS
jgi:hypothetical protein